MKKTYKKIIPLDIKKCLIKIRTIRAFKNNPAFKKLLDPKFYFQQYDDTRHMESILTWYQKASQLSNDGGIPMWIDLYKYSKDNFLTIEPSFPETSGYILTSLIFYDRSFGKKSQCELINNILQYLLKVQGMDGSFSNVYGDPRPLAFDTGQALTGLVSYYKYVNTDKSVKESIEKAADWMADSIMSSGEYKLNTVYNKNRAYYAQATNGLVQAGLLFGQERWLSSAKRNSEYIYSLYSGATWFDKFSFEDGASQNLHGIAYTLRGMLDLGRFLNEDKYLEAVFNCLDRLLLNTKDRLLKYPGYFKFDFVPVGSYSSPTGMSQLAIVLYIAATIKSDPTYKNFADRLVDQVKNYHFDGFTEKMLNGLLPGSWPVYGPYAHASLPNWPAKFFLDALIVKNCDNSLSIEG